MSKILLVAGETYTHPGLIDIALEISAITHVSDSGVGLDVDSH